MNSTHAFSGADAPRINPSVDSNASESQPQTVTRDFDHGVCSTDPVIDGHETLEAWIKHRETVVRDLHPVGDLESAYAERAALYLWRLNRVIRYEVSATEVNLDEVVQEFMISLDKPELIRDRSELVTLERLREPLAEFLAQFAKWGADATKLPDQKDGLAKIRNEAKRVRRRRILPDQPTIQTITKYEAHLNRCLTSTMAELRRLQKERRQGLREIEETLVDDRERRRVSPTHLPEHRVKTRRTRDDDADARREPAEFDPRLDPEPMLENRDTNDRPEHFDASSIKKPTEGDRFEGDLVAEDSREGDLIDEASREGDLVAEDSREGDLIDEESRDRALVEEESREGELYEAELLERDESATGSNPIPAEFQRAGRRDIDSNDQMSSSKFLDSSPSWNSPNEMAPAPARLNHSTSNGFPISEATPNGIVVHKASNPGVIITMIPKRSLT
jgi:hypothetical protein